MPVEEQTILHSIYALLDPRDNLIRYVGVTKSPLSRRYRQHLQTAQRGKDYPVYRWIRKILHDGICPTILLLETTSDRARETFWIQSLRSTNALLLNCTDGGECFSSEQWEKQRNALRGYIRTPEHNKKLSATKRGKKRSPETIEKMRIAAQSRTYPNRKRPVSFSQEHREHISIAQKARVLVRGVKQPPRTVEHRRKLSESSKRTGFQPGYSLAAKLTPQDVQAIRLRYAQGWMTYKELAAQYAHTGITWRGISKLVRGETWKTVPCTTMSHTPATLGQAALVDK